MGDGREFWVKIRASEAERAEWHAKARAVGLSLSDLVRRSVGRVRTWTVGHTELERERTRELARIGSNLNQIARWANIHKENAGVVEEFEKTAWAGLEPDRYAWAAVQHREAGGGVHVHVLAARCDLETGKSLNIAAPGWQKTFDALRDWQNPTGSASGAPANPAKLTLSLVQKSGASHCDITLSLPLVQKIGLVMRIETFRHDFLSG